MDRYELNVKMEQIKKLARQKEYAAASKIADTIDFYRIKENKSLQLLADVYEASGKYDQAKEILIEAYSRTTFGRQLAYRLVRLCIKSKNISEAEDFYDDFINAAPKDNSKYILQYELATAKGKSLEERIQILETYLSDDMDEKWAFELAKLYHKSGQKDKCVRQCDDIILWFNDGKYVDKAMELKMLYKPLTKSQQEKYEKRWRAKAPSNVNVDEIKVKEYDAANKYNTANIQNALKESMDAIMNESNMYAETSKDEDKQKKSDDLEKTKVVFTDEVVNSLLSHTVKDVTVPSKYNTVPLSPMLDMNSDGQIEMNIEEEPVDDQIEGQLTIGELLDSYEKREAKLKEQNEQQVAAQETKKLYDTVEIGDQIEKTLVETEFYDDDIEENNISEDLLAEISAADELIPSEEETDLKAEPEEKITDIDATKDIGNIHITPEVTSGGFDTSYYSRPKENTETSGDEMYSQSEYETDDGLNNEEEYDFYKKPETEFYMEPENTFGDESETVTEDENTFSEEPEEEFEEGPAYTFSDESEYMPHDETEYGEIEHDETEYNETEHDETEHDETEYDETEEDAFEEDETEEDDVETGNSYEEPSTSDEGKKETEAEKLTQTLNQDNSSEVKELIKDFVAKYSGVQGLDRQLLVVLQQVLINNNTNFIVTGEVKSGKTALAIDLVKIINKIQQTRGRKIAKINGEVLNEGNVSEYFEKLAGMDIIVEKAGSLKSTVASKIIDETEKEGGSRILVLEDEKSSIEAFLKENSMIDNLFSLRVVVKQNKLQDWALVAQKYANSQGYEIDEMGILALHARINELYAFSLLIGKKQVEEIVDNAIKRSKNRKIGRILKLFGREREKKLKEEDFS